MRCIHLRFHLLIVIKDWLTNFFHKMSLIQMEDNDSKTYTQSVQRKLENTVQYRNDNWKMSYGFINTTQKNVVLQQRSTYLLCVSIFIFLTDRETKIVKCPWFLQTYKNRLQNACPADIKLLKRSVQEDLKLKYDELKSKDVDFEECEADLGRILNKVVI